MRSIKCNQVDAFYFVKASTANKNKKTLDREKEGFSEAQSEVRKLKWQQQKSNGQQSEDERPQEESPQAGHGVVQVNAARACGRHPGEEGDHEQGDELRAVQGPDRLFLVVDF